MDQEGLTPVASERSLEPVTSVLKNLLTSLVEHPESIVINPIEGEGTVVFEVQVHSEDTGKVIGKKGRTINALRTILRSATLLESKKVMMELV